MPDTRDTSEQDAYLQAAGVKADLGPRTGRSASAVLGFSAMRLAITLVTTAILARLVPPAEQGLVAMVVPIVMITSGLSEFGLPQAIIQRAEVSHRLVSALFWLNCLFGAVLTLAALGLAPAVGRFYGSEAIVPLMMALAPYIFITVLAIPYVAILRRRMEVNLAERCAFIGVVVGCSAAIGTAVLGGGAWALVVQIIAAQLATLIGVWICVHWHPTMPWGADFRAVKRDLIFGGQLSIDRLLREFVLNAQTVLIGRSFGEAAAGLFFRSQTFALMPGRRIVAPLSGAFVPSLSRLQDDPDAFRTMFARQVSRSHLILVPIGLFMCLAADAVVLVLLGPDWADAVPIMRWLGLLPIAAVFGEACNWALIALGKTGPLLRTRVTTTVILFATMIAASRFDVATFVGCVMIMQCGLVFLYLPYVLLRHTPILVETLRETLLPDILFGAGIAVTVVILRTVWSAPVLVEGIITGVIILAAVAIRIGLSPSYRNDVAKVLRRGTG